MKLGFRISHVFGLLLLSVSFFSQQESSIIYENANGCLEYISDEKNNYIPDFSYAGYNYGATPLPDVPVIKTLDAINGDNTAHIQSALDSIATLEVQENGFRGALLLNPGEYEIHGQLFIRKNGIVLRGTLNTENEGDSTVLRGVGNIPLKRNLITLGGLEGLSWGKELTSISTIITSPFIPAGSRTVEVLSTDLFHIGDRVVIRHPSTDAWLNSINYGDTHVDAPWMPGEIDLYYYRYITNIKPEENKIQLDVPVYDHLNRDLSQSEIYTLNNRGVINNCGIENLNIFIETAGEFDEEHVWSAIKLEGVENCWVKEVNASHFGYAAVYTTLANKVTVKDCAGLEPHSLIEGSRRYNFAVNAFSNNILFENCIASWGRHSYISNGTSSVSGIVWHNGQTFYDLSASEGHRRWSQALLFDNITFIDPGSSTILLGLYNRGSYGTGHGWSSTHSVAWNVKMPFGRDIVVQKPPDRQNYVIACAANITNVHAFVQPLGFNELTNMEPVIPSLYEAQLDARLNLGERPDAPAKLNGVWVSNLERIELNWLDIASDETEYIVEYSPVDTENFIPLAALETNTTQFIQEGVSVFPEGIIYRVYAQNAVCRSAYSNPISLSISTNVEDIEPLDQILVFPNPTSDKLTIESKKAIKHLQLFNSAGVKQAVNTDATYSILDTSSLAPGLYFLKVETINGKFSYLTIIVE